MSSDHPPAPVRRDPITGLDVVLVVVAGLGAGTALAALCFILLEAFGVDVDAMSDIVVGSVGSAFTYGGIVVATYLLVVRRKRIPWRELGLRLPERNFLAMTLLVWFLTLLSTITLAIVITNVFGESPPGVQEQLGLEDEAIGAVELTWLLLVSVLLAPLAEELLFRGLLFDALRRRWPFWPVAVGTGVLFAATHLSLLTIPALTVLGVGLAWLKERYASLYPPILLHAINNAVAMRLLVLTTNAAAA